MDKTTYKLTDGSYNLAIVNGKMEHIFNKPYADNPGWEGKTFKILAECQGLPAYNGINHSLSITTPLQKNDTIIKSEDGIIMFTQKRFLMPTICPCCGRSL